MTFLRVIVFSVAVLLVYTGFANILPQVQSDPPSEEVVEAGSLDMAGMISYGDRLFSGKGTCTLCHNDLGRAPDLLQMDLAATFAERSADAGNASVEEYLREALLEPSVYVVAGFGKKGTNDTESPMPVVDAAPIELGAVEINAVIAFLQDRAGMPPTVPLPSADDAPAVDDGNDEQAEPLAASGAEAIEKFFCSGCHDLEDSEADVGPALNGLASRMSRGELMEAILEPNGEIAEGYDADVMPTDFDEQMHSSELILIVDYLMALPE